MSHVAFGWKKAIGVAWCAQRISAKPERVKRLTVICFLAIFHSHTRIYMNIHLYMDKKEFGVHHRHSDSFPLSPESKRDALRVLPRIHS